MSKTLLSFHPGAMPFSDEAGRGLENGRTGDPFTPYDAGNQARAPGARAISEPRNRVVRVSRFGEPDGLEVADAPMPLPRRGEVRVRVLASGLEYTDTLIRRHVYPQTWLRRPPFAMGYDVVGEVDALGPGVTGFAVGDRVADMTVVGSNAAYRTLRADDLTRVPAGVDPAEAATLILSWTTAYQMLHRAAGVQRGQRVLVHGAAGAVGQAAIVLGKLAGLEVWGTARAENAEMVRALGATPIDYRREDFTRAVAGGFDVIFDGVAEDGYRRSHSALAPRGKLIAIGYSAAVQERRSLASILGFIARLYIWSLAPRGRSASFYSINLLRALRPEWFKQDLEELMHLLATGAIRPRVAGRVSFDEVADAHRRIESGGLDGKLVLCPGALSTRRGCP
jgi:NADPH:quinone reductase-like Zn-dependent oxidoreductase